MGSEDVRRAGEDKTQALGLDKHQQEINQKLQLKNQPSKQKKNDENKFLGEILKKDFCLCLLKSYDKAKVLKTLKQHVLRDLEF